MKKSLFKRILSLVLTLSVFISALPSFTFSTGAVGAADTTWYTAEGGSTAESPYVIGSAEALLGLASLVNAATDPVNFDGKFIKLTADLGISDIANWTPIGNSSMNTFKGTFDGNGRVIGGLKIDSGTYKGLFGYTAGAVIKNLGVTDLNMTGSTCIGGIIGKMTGGSITDCYTTGTITSSSSSIGGIVGWALGSSIINCLSSCSVQGTKSVGGIVGETTGSVSNCAALNISVKATTIGTDDVGRVVGKSTGTLTDNIAWSGMPVNDVTVSDAASSPSSDKNGLGKSIADLSVGAGFPSGFTTSPWTYTAGSLPGFGTAVRMPVHLGGIDPNAIIISDITATGTGWSYDNATKTYTVTDDVNVIGTLTGELDPITFDIASGKKVTWTATLKQNKEKTNAINLTGDGELKITNGLIEAVTNETNSATIYVTGTNAKVTVSGGTIRATTGLGNNSSAIKTSNAATGSAITITGTGIVESTNGHTIISYGNVTVSGGKVQSGGDNISGVAIKVIANNNTPTVTVSGGEVSNTGSGSGISLASNTKAEVTSGKVSAVSNNAISASLMANSVITVSGGTVRTATGSAIVSTHATSTVTISGADTLVQATENSGNGIVTNGTLTVDGGTISATTGNAIKTNSTNAAHTMTINGGTITSASAAAISGSSSYTTVNVTSGTISSGTYAICYTEVVNISGGTLSTTGSTAIYNNFTSTVTVSGGLVTGRSSAVIGSGGVIDLINSTDVTFSGTGIALAMPASPKSSYKLRSTTDLDVMPNTAAAIWGKSGDGSKIGINYANGSNTGFTQVAGVTAIDKITLTTDRLTYTDPATFTSLIYDGTEQAGIGIVSVNDTEFSNTTGGTVTVKYNSSTTVPTDAGTYAVTAEISGGIEYAETSIPLGDYIIAKAPLTIKSSGHTITGKIYDTEKTAAVTVVAFDGLVNGETLTLTTDYTVEAAEFDNANVDTGKAVTATVSLVADGTTAKNYSLANGALTGASGNITAASITDATVTVNGTYSYTGSAQTPSADDVVVTLNGKTLTNTDYDFAVTAGGTNIGTATVTVTAKGNYKDTANGTFSIGKANQNAPLAPTLDSKTTESVTLIANSLHEFSKDGTVWQTGNVFSGLTPNTAYTFYARVKGDSNNNDSPSSPVLNVTTDRASLGGSIVITGTEKFGETLTVDATGLTSTPSVALGTLSYQWIRNYTDIDTNSASYTLTEDDIGQIITVTVISENCIGTISSSTSGTIAKAVAPSTPAPVTGSYTGNGTSFTYTITTIEGAEYSKNNINWQDSNVFTGFTTASPATTFYARIKTTATHEASASNNTGVVSFIKLANAATPMLAFTVSDSDFPKTVTITAVNGCEYSFDAGTTWSDDNIYLSDTEETLNLSIHYKETATHNASAAATNTVNTNNQNQAAPDAFKLTYEQTGETYTVTIPTTEGAEYSFDGTNWSSTNTKTGCEPETTATGYKRMAAKTGYNVSSAVSDTITLPAIPVDPVDPIDPIDPVDPVTPSNPGYNYTPTNTETKTEEPTPTLDEKLTEKIGEKDTVKASISVEKSDDAITISEETLKAAAEAGKELVIMEADENGKTQIQWNIPTGSKIDGDASLSADLSTVKGNKALANILSDDKSNKNKGAVVEVNGNIPEGTTLRLRAEDIPGLKAGDKAIVYMLNEKTGKLEETTIGEIKLSSKGVITLPNVTEGTYVILPKANKDVVSLVKQVKATVSKKSIVLNKTAPINFDLPHGLTMDDVKIKLTSSDPEGLQVSSKSLKLKPLKKGTYKIKIEIELPNGEKRTTTMTITV